jgi:hypothetical protein
MGVVYRAHDFALDRRVSLKLLRAAGKDPEARRERLVSEAQALARVSHPNVLAVHDVGTWDDEVYLALEHVEGETLRSWLDRTPRNPAEIRGMFLQAARGLQAIHDAGLVHRDVKPENLLVGRDGRLRVADLGLAITAGSPGPDPGPETLQPGTPGYMPLEQHRGEPLDPRADQFSLAVAIHEALLGVRPYGSRGASRESLEARLARGPGVEVRSAAVPQRLRRALTAALSPDREQRPPTLAPLIEALAAPGVRKGSTVGGSLALTASMGVLLMAMARGNAAPVGIAQAATWLPPAYEFQVDGMDPADPVAQIGTGAPQLGALVTGVPESPAPARASAVSATTPVIGAAIAPRGPEVVTIGRQLPEPPGQAAVRGPTLDLDRLAELRGLVEALYRALTEKREGSTGPLLALSPTGATAGMAPAGGAAANAAPLQLASLESGGGGGSAPEFADPSGQTISAIERRLDQQIRQNRSASEIAETRFTLAQAIWNASDAEDAQSRALTLARQSKAALDAVADQDTTVVELRDAVNDWISEREGPVGKPPRGGHLIHQGRSGLKIEPVDKVGWTATDF